VRRALASLALVVCVAAAGPQDEFRRPNVVLLLADDLGWTDLGCAGSTYYETPHIDALAAAGVRFTDAYACPNCAPTRATLWSGRYPPSHGVYTVGSGARGKAENRRLEPVRNQRRLTPEVVTLAESLSEAGYATGFFGKWHLGDGDTGPLAQGFDVNAGGNLAGHPRSYFSPYQNPDLEDGPEGEYLTERLTDEALQFAGKHRAEPFFLALAYYTVHTPIQPIPALLRRFAAKEGDRRHDHPGYAAMVSALDTSVGRILARLDELELREHTLVIFMSDNGGVGGYEREGVKGGELTDNAPLRGGKGMLYEGGVRVPLIVRLPGTTPRGVTAAAPVGCVDLYPTVLQATRTRSSVELDGQSFLDVLHAPEEAHARAPLYWHFPGYLQGHGDGTTWRTTPAGAMRDGEWKLLEFFEDGRLELYHLATDIGERTNLVAEEPERATALHARLVAWRREVAATMPGPKEAPETER